MHQRKMGFQLENLLKRQVLGSKLILRIFTSFWNIYKAFKKVSDFIFYELRI